jgi:hypothetical protein
MAERKVANRANEGNAVARVRLLTDEPATTDEFAAGAHQRVATAIAQLVESEPGGKVIGLEGSWGSGKSTVVRLIRNSLADKSTKADMRVVVFDAWAHQGDPLRRTFLEALIGELEAANWLDTKTAEGSRNELTGRTSVVTTKSQSSLSLEGKLAAGATVLLALGAALFSNHFHTQHRLALFLGAFLLVLPLLVVLGLWLARQFGLRLGGATGKGWRRRLAELKPSGFFASDKATETLTEGVQRGEPTSVEFERIFSDVLSASLAEPRRLLLVLDNLDRVEEDDARTVLATMQTFTGSGQSVKEWSPRVWTLIPYDPHGLRRLWDRGGASDDQLQIAQVPSTGTTAAFLDKVFQIRFEAPPLVLSDWRTYFMRLLEQALPDADAAHLRAVLRLRDLYPGVQPEGVVSQEEPTPRQLKQFVNQIGAICRQRADISLVHLAYYTLLKRDGVEIPRGLLAGTLPDTKLAHVFGSDVREDLAAMHFGTTQELAQQLLIGPALDGAFAAGDVEVVAQLRERAGFVDTLERLDIEDLAFDGGIELTRAVAVLGASGALDVKAVDEWARARLEPVARSTTQWRLQGRDTGVGLALLLNRIAPEDDQALNEYLERAQSSPVAADTEGRGHLEGIAGLVDELATLGRADSPVRVNVDLPSDRLIESLAYLQEHSERAKATKILDLTASPVDVSNALVAAAVANRVADVERALSMLLERRERVSLADLAEGGLTWLRSNEPASQEQLAVFLSWLDRARRSGDPESVLGAAADDGTLMDLVALASSNEWHVESAAASMLYLVVRPELSPEPEPVRQAPTGTAKVRQVLATPQDDAQLAGAQLAWLKQHKREAFELIANVSKGSAQAWVDQQMRALSEAGELVTSSAQFVHNWEYLRRVLGQEHFVRHTRQILDVPAGRERVLAEIRDPLFALDALDASELETDADYSPEIKAWAGNILKTASADDWSRALQTAETTEPLLELAVRLAGAREAPTNPVGLQDGLHAHFKLLAGGDGAWHPDGQTFAKLTRLLGANSRRVLASQICAELEGRDGQVGPELFLTYGEFFAGETAFRTHPKLPNVLERFVARDQWDVVAWFVDIAQRYEDTLGSGGREEEMAHLKDSVAERLASAGDESPESLRELGQELGIPEMPDTPEAEAPEKPEAPES